MSKTEFEFIFVHLDQEGSLIYHYESVDLHRERFGLYDEHLAQSFLYYYACTIILYSLGPARGTTQPTHQKENGEDIP